MADLETTYGDGSVTTRTNLGQGAGITLPDSLTGGGPFDIGGMGGLFKAVLARRMYEADLKAKMAMQEAALRERESDLRMKQAEAELAAQRRREEEDQRRYRDAQQRARHQDRLQQTQTRQRQIEEQGEPIYAKTVSSFGGLLGKAGNLETTPWDPEGAFTGHYRKPGAVLSGHGGTGAGYVGGGLAHGGGGGGGGREIEMEEPPDTADDRYFKAFGRRPGEPYEELPGQESDVTEPRAEQFYEETGFTNPADDDGGYDWEADPMSVTPESYLGY